MKSRAAFLIGPALGLALLPSSVVAAAMPLLLAEWDASATTGGWVFAAYQIGYLGGVLFVLPLTDRAPTALVITACAVATSIGSLLFPLFAFDPWSASALRFLGGIGLAGIYLPGVRIVASAATAARRGFVVGAYVSAFYLGAAVSLWATGLLLPAHGWRGAALWLGAATLLTIPLGWLSARGLSATPGGRASLDLSVLAVPPIRRIILAYTGHSWELYVSRGWLAYFITSALIAGGAESQAAAAEGSQWAALMAAFGTPGVWLGGWLSDHFGRARAAVAVAGISGAISLLFGFLVAAPFIALLVVGCLYGLLQSADSAVYSTSITELAPPGRLGSAQAVQAFVGFGATAIAPVAAGWTLDLGMGWIGVFGLAGVVGLALALPLARATVGGNR